MAEAKKNVWFLSTFKYDVFACRFQNFCSETARPQLRNFTFATKAQAEKKLTELRWDHINEDYDWIETSEKWWREDPQELDEEDIEERDEHMRRQAHDPDYLSESEEERNEKDARRAARRAAKKEQEMKGLGLKAVW